MPSNQPPTDSLLEQAAELRATGMSWEAVAARLDRSPETVRKWPAAYPGRWQALLRAAERRLITDAGAESVLILRTLLRSVDEKIRRDAARLLLNLGLELTKLETKAAARNAGRATTRDAVVLLAHMLGCYTDEQLAQLVVAEFDRCPGSLPLLAADLGDGPP